MASFLHRSHNPYPPLTTLDVDEEIPSDHFVGIFIFTVFAVVVAFMAKSVPSLFLFL